jgi:hypothetical protein
VEEVTHIARELFRNYASAIWRGATEDPASTDALYEAHPGEAAFTTYPVRCLRIVEFLGLLALLVREDDPKEAANIARYLCVFIESQPGAWHPISDRWATSLIPCALATAPVCGEVVDGWLRRLVVWVADHYDHEPGLAGPSADPEEEIAYLLGGPLDHVSLVDRKESYVAAVILDLLAVLGYGETYDLALNDFLAVEALPSLIVAEDNAATYSYDEDGLARHVNVSYPPEFSGFVEDTRPPHHMDTGGQYFVERQGREWDLLAIQTVLRDRHFVGLMQRMLIRRPEGATSKAISPRGARSAD